MNVNFTNHSLPYSEIQSRSNTFIPNPIVFEYSKRKWVDSSGVKLNQSKLNGLSGSPLLRLYGSAESGVSCFPIGIFVEYHKTCNELVFSPLSVAIDVIRDIHS